jgi:3-dehydroquinate synthase
MRDGFAEVIKYGIILDKELYNNLLKKESSLLEQIISRCIEIKRDVVAADEFDKGERQLLNFGHTLGHSIELLSNFTITHGEAVAKGMVIAAKLGKECGYADVVEPIKNIVEMYGFDTYCPYSATEIYKVALSDKKRDKNNITVVLPESIGKCVLHTISTEEFYNLLKRIKL